MKNQLTNKFVVVILICSILQSCVPFALYQNAYNAATQFINPEPFKLNPAIKDLPYAMQLVEYRNSTIIMILAYVDNKDSLSFVDSENRGFTLYHGKIINSTALENNLEIINPPNIKEIFLKLYSNIHQEMSHDSLLRFEHPKTPYLNLNMTFNLVASNNNNEFLINRLTGQSERYFLLEEHFHVPIIDWHGKNTYWISQEGNILKSKQFIFPNQPKYFFETLKNYEGN